MPPNLVWLIVDYSFLICNNIIIVRQFRFTPILVLYVMFALCRYIEQLACGFIPITCFWLII